MEQKFDLKLQENSEKLGSGGRTSTLKCKSPDYDAKDINNIYVDCKCFVLDVDFVLHKFHFM